MKTYQRHSIVVLALLFASLHPAAAQGTAFTYQGRLSNGTNAVTGSYDLTFALFSVSSGGSAVAGPVTNSPTAVTNGLFTVTLDFGANFPGAGRWLEIGVRTNGGGAFTNLSPRQQITAAPYAITASNLTGTVSGTGLAGTYSSAVTFNNAGSSYSGSGSGLTSLNASQLTSGTVPSARLSGTYSSAVTFNNAANSFSGNGSGLTSVNAAFLGGLSAFNFWQTAGNSGTLAGPNFLGTTDNQPLELHVFGQRAFRLEPDPVSPNVIGGHPSNTASIYFGVTIGGGGYALGTNAAQGNFAVIGGGAANQAGELATVSGGITNLAVGKYSVIGGGIGNFAAQSASVSGGTNNQAVGVLSVIGGGFGNVALPLATVSGGSSNQALALLSVISGGGTNQALGQYSVIGGGTRHQTIGAFSTVSGGSNNVAFGYASTVGGGDLNRANALESSVGGGVGNNSLSPYATVGGGYYNNASAQGATVGGGAVNGAYGNYATVGGGLGNLATNVYTTVGGGINNIASGTNSTVGGGTNNLATGSFSTIPGGKEASSTQYGQLANASGAFTLPGDAQHSIFVLRAVTAAGFLASTNLTLDGSTNAVYLTISSNRTMTFHILLTARVDPSTFLTESAGFEVSGAVKDVGGSALFVGGLTPTFTSLGQDNFSWTVNLSTIGNALLITVNTGGYPFPVRWVARVDTVEVAW